MITSKLFDDVLIRPLFEGANRLLVVSGYATSAMAFHHLRTVKGLKKEVELSLIVGMTPTDGLSLTNHLGFVQIAEADFPDSFECSYVFQRPSVHSKLFLWLRGNRPLRAFVGSANYTQIAFLERQREILTECDPEVAFAYFHDLDEATVYCTNIDADRLVQIYSDKQFKQQRESNVLAPEQFEKTQVVAGIGSLSDLPNVSLSFLAKDGSLPERSGLNWGQRPEYNRNPNQAYIKVPIDIARSGFFPERGIRFTVLSDDNIPFICVVAQQNDKAIETPDGNNQLGEYFRNRLLLQSGDLVQKKDLEAFGRTEVTFYKLDEETYYMDFSPPFE